jgi:linoleoyl-CoA desaturase
MYAIGGNPVNWRIQHNMLHHGFTNIHGMDEDISAGKLLRMSPEQKRYRFHRFQHYYAWFLYSIMTIYWFLGKDIPQLIRYRKMGLLSQQKSSFKKIMTSLVLNKFAYGFFALLLPIIVVDIPWWQTLLFFIGMHLVAGLLLGLVFQPAHVIADNEFPIPDEKGKIQNNWMVHQVLTTANYAPKSRIFSWFIGGLNFQIEHHLFANICHVHYHKISPIVQQAVKEFGLPYHVNRTFFSAIANHARMLRQLGKYEKALS